MVAEPETEVLPQEDNLDHEFEGPSSAADQASANANNVSSEENSVKTVIEWDKFEYSCLKVMDRKFGAPAKTYLVGNTKEKIVIDLTANSVLFLSNVITCHLARHQMCWTILNCFTKIKQRIKISNKLRLLERNLENASLYDMFNLLPCVNVINNHSRNTPLDSSMIVREKKTSRSS